MSLPLARATALIAGLCLALPAQAEDAACRDRIAAMMQGGALDPFVRPPHRFTNTVTAPDGSVRYVFLTIWDSPARGVSGIEGSGTFTLIVDGDSWTGPGPDGPWTPAPNQLPEDYEASQRAMQAQMLDNLDDTACPGMVEIDGKSHDTVRYFTRTDPNDDMGGAWFGAMNTVYIDPATDRVMRWEMTDFVSSFAPEVNKDLHTQVFAYDPTISLARPD